MKESLREFAIDGQHKSIVNLGESRVDIHIRHTEFIIDLLVVDQYRTDHDEYYESPITGDEIIMLKCTTEKLTKLLEIIKV